MLTVPTLPALSLTHPWDAASERGPRTVNADATSVHHDQDAGRWAFAVADGIGDDPAAAVAARLAARIATEVATTDGPVAGLLAAHRELAGHPGDAVLVVAVPNTGPSGLSCDIAWVGDCRAYHYNGRVLEQITVDQTVAEYFRARSLPTTPRMSHLVTTSVRTLRPELIGSTRTGFASGRLLLCSDGVHKTLGNALIRQLLDRPGRIAADLVGSAHELGGRDNATALVVEQGTSAPIELAA